MADTAKRLYGPAQPGTSAADLYTVPGSTTAIVRSIHLTNTSDSDAWVSLSIGTTGIDTAASRFFDKLNVPANSTISHGAIDWSGFLVLAAAERITGKQGTASAITVTISGVEVA